MKKTIQYNNGNILSYAEYGDPNGYPILIQHGLIASITDAHLFARLIENGARLICAARPGYGDSSPYALRNIGEWGEIVSALAEELGLAQFDVLGISSGAPYSYAIGWKCPARVRRLFILSGTPALYADAVLACWPYPVDKQASLAEMQALAHALFFSPLSPTDQEKADIRDSLRNDCFGVGLDLKIRCLDWGFELAEVSSQVLMRHSRADGSVPLITAQITAGMLPDCRLEIRENDEHFSQEVLDDFISTVMIDRSAA